MPLIKDKRVSGSVLESNEVAGTRLELLLFKVNDAQTFGINVFKVQEIIPSRKLTQVPGAHPLVRGIAHLRGSNMPIIDLAAAIGKPPFQPSDSANIVITEYNRSVHGFLVGSVDRIVYTQWDQVRPPPKGTGRNTFVTSITVIDGQMVAILDVEKILDAVVSTATDVSAAVTEKAGLLGRRVMVVDDSSVARNQIQRSLEQIGVECLTAANGRDAVQLLHQLIAQGVDLKQHLAMIISDIEMPEMDGYQLTAMIRSLPQTHDMYILLHSSISGEFNVDMVKKTGANQFIQKYCPDDLASAVAAQITA